MFLLAAAGARLEGGQAVGELEPRDLLAGEEVDDRAVLERIVDRGGRNHHLVGQHDRDVAAAHRAEAAARLLAEDLQRDREHDLVALVRCHLRVHGEEIREVLE